MKKTRILSIFLAVVIAMSLMTFALATEATVAADAAPVDQPWYAGIIQFLPIIIICLVFYFVLIRPEKKRKKETENMRNNIAVGDKITTIGGIIGKVTTVREDQIIIETSNENNKIRLTKWAVSSVDKKSSDDADEQ